ncbi:MAG TPA: class I SAM-dependent methyltransferase [Egibacteraceae bacterium]|jgi:SAM-dependent methyltransferase|nr:class I SAM-dependent methyltransferase [Egibacteraceae bacterium]
MGSAHAQGPLWGAAAEEFAELLEPTATPIYEAAFDGIGVTTATRLLDVGCGAGLALQLAHKRGAAVTGLDASEQLLAVARSRLPDADLRQGDVEELPYASGSFDAVTAFNSVQYATDPVQALREVKRVAFPRAPVAVATWGDPERCQARAIIAAIGGLLPPPPPGAGGPFALAAPGALEALVESATLTVERALEVPTPFTWPDVGTAVRANLSPGPARAAINHSGIDRVRDALTAVFEACTGPDGSVRLDNVFRVVVAHA